MNGRRLIFYFYAVPGFEDNRAYDMHFACLKRYSSLFESAKFFIALDDTGDRELTAKVASRIVSCGFVENTEFIVIKNDIYREAAVFKSEISDRLGELSGLTFFAHTKGVSNILDNKYSEDSVLKWIFGCYYLSLEFIDEVHNQMQVYQPFCQRFFYGSFLRCITSDDGGGTKYGAEYEGTFFWVNCVSLYNYLKENDVQVPNEIGRFYAERFPGNIFPVGERVGSHEYRFFYSNASLYNECDTILSLLLDEDELKKLYAEYGKIISGDGK